MIRRKFSCKGWVFNG